MAANRLHSAAAMTDLPRLRGELTAISLALLDLVNLRARRALEVDREKQRLGLPIRDAFRERQLLDSLVAANAGPLDEAAVRAIFRAVIDGCVAAMERQRAAGAQPESTATCSAGGH